ncbi:hypothetical protein QL285_033782 [Trifolium repens]|nr:hypothetical protein QL285_033782 [Trifolium repens]
MHASSLKVSEVIHNHQWHLTPELETNFPTLKNSLEKIITPLEGKDDFLAWNGSDSAVLAFSSNALVPWAVRNRWHNCKLLIRRMNFIITHIYREGNDTADSMANLGSNIDNASYFWVPPPCIINSLYRNRLGLPSFRFTTY